jgi:hypothetical protein
MSIVFILLGALATTLWAISKMGLDLPPQAGTEIDYLPTHEQSREDVRIAA